MGILRAFGSSLHEAQKPDKLDLTMTKYSNVPWYLDMWPKDGKTHSLLNRIFTLMLGVE